MRRIIILISSLGFALLPCDVEAVTFPLTLIRARATVYGRQLCFGVVTYTGTHSATIVSLNPAHANRTWTLRGEIQQCGAIFFPRLSSCEVSGVAQVSRQLSCTTRRDHPCHIEVQGWSKGSMFLVTSDTFETLCYQRHCDDTF
jgi:hypothetical protein